MVLQVFWSPLMGVCVRVGQCACDGKNQVCGARFCPMFTSPWKRLCWELQLELVEMQPECYVAKGNRGGFFITLPSRRNSIR
jgi:hypothetical protein